MSMKYMIEHERTVFLHFLNREAHSACKAKPDYNAALTALDALSIAHCSSMTVNISQLLEFAEENNSFLRVVFELQKHGIISMISQATSINDFISSRQKIYEHDKNRYPMYFGQNQFIIERFKLSIHNPISTTDALFKDIVNWDPDELIGPVNEAISENDRRIIKKKSDEIQSITVREKGRAVTRAVYLNYQKEEGLSNHDIDAISRMISGIYIKKYKGKDDYVTICGYPNLQYYDDLRNFPYYDLIVLNRSLQALGYYRINVPNSDEKLQERIVLYKSDIHRRFVSAFNTLIGCIFGGGEVNSYNITSNRERISNILIKSISDIGGLPLVYNNLQHFFEVSIDKIDLITAKLSASSPAFASIFADFIKKGTNMRRILLLTATPKEDRELIKVLSDAGIVAGSPRQVGKNIARTFESSLPIEIFHLRSGAGSAGSNGSTVVTAEAIRELAPNHVISVGICFGAKEGEQNLGDVLISREMFHYDSAREGEEEHISRGQKLPASEFLLAACQLVNLEGVEAHYGIMASGETLVDSKDFLQFIKEQQPEYIGGEMEGTGISSACQRERTDWIMIKGICDWGHGKTKDFQPQAAKNAALFATDVIKIIAKL